VHVDVVGSTHRLTPPPRKRFDLVATPLILARHARPVASPERAPGSWASTEDGIADARRLGLAVRNIVGAEAATVVASTERKAVETAEALGLGAVRTDERLCEVPRPWHEDQRSFRAAEGQLRAGSGGG
jgi:broad specificity phosphatase PhoE